MMISASYRTDIPTFYGEWFLNRLNAGYCVVENPYNHRYSRVSLLRQDVDGFVFWTKNVGPFVRQLVATKDMGFPFVIQHSLNGYPQELEPGVGDVRDVVAHVRHVAETFGKKVCVWRYDPILITSLTPVGFHLDNFSELAGRLEGTVDEVVISFGQMYRKTLQNLGRGVKAYGLMWSDPSVLEKRELAAKLVAIAGLHGIRLSVCSQKAYIVPGSHAARCVDAERFEAISGRQILPKLGGNRKECGCCESIDIGDYDTCPHGCVYCYAVRSRAAAVRRFKAHDPTSEYLFERSEKTQVEHKCAGRQLPLFHCDTALVKIKVEQPEMRY